MSGFQGDDRDYPERKRQLAAMVEGLIQRPTLRSSEPGVRGEQALPLIYLVGDAGDHGFLGVLERKLDVLPSPRVPFTVIDAESVDVRGGGTGDEGAGDGEPPLVPLLHLAARDLSRDLFSSHRPMRFSHYSLVRYLNRLELPDDESRSDDRAINEALRAWSGRSTRSAGLVTDEAVNDLPSWWLRMAARMLTAAGRLMGSRITGAGREGSWLMRRQRYLVPNHSTKFVGFAHRLTAGQRHAQDPEQLKKLLVHAFLEDLRANYRRRGRVLPRRAGWRRTAYPVLLLKGASEENGGWELLRLINEVRNETGEHDPLLVIASGRLPDGIPHSHVGVEAEAALTEWRRELPGRRQRMAPYARYLWLAGAGAHETGAQPEGAEGFAPFRRPPWLTRRGVGETVLSLALVAALLPLTANVMKAANADCPSFDARSSAGVSVTLMKTANGGKECVGYSDGAKHTFGSKAPKDGDEETSRLWNAQRLVFEQNAKAKQLQAANPARPLVTLVYLADLTPREEGVPATADASAEELEGLVMRQRQEHGDSSSRPLLRIVVGNGGKGMLNAPNVVEDMVVPLAEKDPTVMGVIGLDRTIDATKEVIST